MNHGGYEYHFVEGILEDMCVCKICHLPSRDPQLSVCCGHTFCKSCLEAMKQYGASHSKLCPMCRNKKSQVFPNKQVDRKIRSLHVFCVNNERGCEWQGELNNLDVHLNSDCEYEDVECTHGCGETLQRQHITMHMEVECSHRKINCPYCNLSGIHSFITGDHKEECPMVVIPCPNHCETDNIFREDMEEHRKVCSLEVVSCKYMKLGCGTRLARKEVEKHGKEKVEEHLHLALEKLEKLEDTTCRLESIVSQMKWLSYITSQVSSDTHCPVIIKVAGFADKRSEEIRWKSHHFYTDNEGYEMFLKVRFARHYLKLHLLLGLNEEYYDVLDWPLRGRFDVSILNQISDSEHYSRTIFYDDRCSDEVAGRDTTVSWGLSQFISYDQLCATSSTCQYINDDIMYIKVSFSSFVIINVEDDD